MIKVIIAGGRTFNNYKLLEKECNKIFHEIDPQSIKNIEIVSGTAYGADKLGEKFANEYGLSLSFFPAAWDHYGKSAGYKRNEQMAIYAKDSDIGVLIAFWDGVSRGTKHMIDLANKHGLKIYIVSY